MPCNFGTLMRNDTLMLKAKERWWPPPSWISEKNI